ncbi:hypothetical protein [Nigerium massiliense]|uniref:hypothetical protein n=1 Tax=Nigerium massiliense TaxID=1522317 RepID=UPI00058EB911|nr:hypothetical protein [Nigerium massiliense]
MSPEIIIIAIIAVGGVVVAIGWARDQSRQGKTLRDLTEAPPGDVPGWDGSDVRYLPEVTLRGNAAEQSAAPSSSQSALIARRDESQTIPAGAPDPEFLNVGSLGLAVLADPLVLVCEGEVTELSATLNVLGIAAKQGRPFVWVAADFDDRTLDTLRANTITGKLQCLPISLLDPGHLRTIAAQTGGRVIEPSDAAAGYLPDSVWGTCAGWISDLDDSWLITDAGDLSRPPR